MSRTWTSRNTNAPDWLLWARRTPVDLVPPDSVSATATQQDPERGAIEPGTSDNKTATEGVEREHVPALGPASMISDATAVVTTPNAALVRSFSASSLSRVRTCSSLGGLRAAFAPTFADHDPVPQSFHDSTRLDTKIPTTVATADITATAADPVPASVPEGPEMNDEPSPPPSGTQTPVSPRVVRFPSEDELPLSRAPVGTSKRGPGNASASGGGAPLQPRTVRFPEPVAATADLGVPPGEAAEDGAVGAGTAQEAQAAAPAAQ